jgi:hypothetical protein
MAFVFNVDNLLDDPLAVIFVPVDDIRGERGADEAMA